MQLNIRTGRLVKFRDKLTRFIEMTRVITFWNIKKIGNIWDYEENLIFFENPSLSFIIISFGPFID